MGRPRPRRRLRRATRLSALAGFDFVLNPGYNANRGYVLESAGEGNDIDRDFILESVAKATGLADAKVEEMVDGWRAQSVLYASDLEERLEEAALYEAALVEKLTGREVAIMVQSWRGTGRCQSRYRSR